MNTKIIIAIGAILVVGGVISYFIYNQSMSSPTPSQNSQTQQEVIQPERMSEINGYIVSAQGNELVVENEIGKQEMSDEDRAARQKLSPEERQALRAQEAVGLTKEEVSITIPVGVPVVKGSGTGDQESVSAEISELQKGVYVSVWMSGDVVEYVKLKGTSAL